MRIFQGYFDETSRRHIDPAATPVDISFNLNHPLYEYNIFKTLLAKGIMDPAVGPVGLLSWKFTTKTLIAVGEFQAFCENAFAAGADVAFINPMIAAEALCLNVWEHGEHTGHKGMLQVVDALFPDQPTGRMALMPKSVFAFCNYFVGNARFWTLYISFCEKMLEKIESFKTANPHIYELIYGSAHYQRNKTADFRPFILERLFSSFLLLQPGIGIASFDYAPQMYEKKFGADLGKYICALSGLKNNGIRSGAKEQMNVWNQARCRLLNPPYVIEPAVIWSRDDPAPNPA